MSRIEAALQKATRLRNISSRSSSDIGKPLHAECISDLGEVAPYISTLHDPASPVSEEYRKLKSMVVKLTKHGGLKNTVMVTSALSREGKSITAINLAVTMSQEYDHTVLLIDADLRNPSLHKYLDVVPDAGLADCLSDGLGIGAALVKFGKGHLTFLPSGRSVKNPAELLSSLRMREFLEEMKHRYSDRYIIIDAPPVLPFAEAFTIGSMVDGIVFVVKEGMASLESVSNALDILKDNNVLGMVYNDVRLENPYGHYSASYKYAVNKKEREGQG